MIDRILMHSLMETMSYFPVVGIIGPRQVGKTTLAKQLIANTHKDSIYLDLENPRDTSRLADPVLFFERNIDRCVVLDEIQRMPELFPILRSMVDMKREPARFIILGSASPELIRDSSESLAGRIVYEELTPFNVTEIGRVADIFQHWISGGFPSSLLANSNFIRSKWRSNFIKTYIERDLPMLGLDVNRNLLQRFWIMLAHMHGNLLNMTSLSKSLTVTATTVKRYISFMESAFLIRLMQPYSANVKKRLVKSPKVYIRDSGILHQLLAINDFDELESNPILGNSWEGYAIEQIIQRIDENLKPYFYRTQEGAECDLVLVKGGVVAFAIEIKYTSAPKITKGMRISFEDLGTNNNFVITPNGDDFLLAENVRTCNLETFLCQYLLKL
ncbi:MAG: ATP-binding protein [Prolixibacteraceae bacterium]